MSMRLAAQRGVAIITALLVVVLAASIATYLLAQQSHALTRTERAIGRAQAALYAGPTLDFARAVLAEAQGKSTYVSYNQPWAQGIAAMPIEEAIASGLIRDEAGKFNLNNLLVNGQTPSAADIAVFKRLLTKLDLNPDLADAVIDWIDADSQLSPAGAEDSFYMSLPRPYRAANQPLVQWQELARVRGFDAKTMQRLAPFATALPARTLINLNTAPSEVLAALLPNLNDSDIANILRVRETLPYLNADPNDLKVRPELQKLTPAILASLPTLASASSDFYLVSIAINSSASQVRQTALLQRDRQQASGAAAQWPRIIWAQTQ
jgi:general secretion pathway protein K